MSKIRRRQVESVVRSSSQSCARERGYRKCLSDMHIGNSYNSVPSECSVAIGQFEKTKPICRPLAGNPKHEARNPKRASIWTKWEFCHSCENRNPEFLRSWIPHQVRNDTALSPKPVLSNVERIRNKQT